MSSQLDGIKHVQEEEVDYEGLSSDAGLAVRSLFTLQKSCFLSFLQVNMLAGALVIYLFLFFVAAKVLITLPRPASPSMQLCSPSTVSK